MKCRFARQTPLHILRRCTAVLLLLAILFSAVSLQPFHAQAANTALPASWKTQSIVTLEPTLKPYKKAKYDQLLAKVNRVLKKKKFSKIACRFIREGLEQIYWNYAEWRTAYKDLPDIERYVDETIIPALKNTSSIRMISIKSKEAKKMLREGDALAATRGDECDVYLIYEDPKTCTIEDHLMDLEMLFHELAHCRDKKTLFRSKYFLKDDWLADIYHEGGATFHMKFVSPLTPNNTAAALIFNSDQTKEISYGKSNGAGYFLHLYIYENLVYLAGYDVVESVGKGKSISIIRDAIEKKYGFDTATDIWDGLYKLYENYNQRGTSNASFRQAIRLQNTILTCIEQDIKKLNVKKPAQIRKYMDIYRTYKFKVMPQIQTDTYHDITPKCFDTDRLDQLLIKKIEQSGAIRKLSKNKQLNRMALKAILLGNNNSYSKYEFLYLPTNISGTEYLYFEKNGKGHLITLGKNNYGYKEGLEIIFNESKILKIDEAPYDYLIL